MTRKPEIAHPPRSAMAVSIPTKRDFQRTCFELELKPHLVLEQVLRAWVEKNKKKIQHHNAA